MLSFRVFVALHPHRFVPPPPRDLCGRRLPRPCRGVVVHQEKIIRVGLVDRRTPAHSLIGRSLRTRRSRPCRDWLGIPSNASPSTFNRRSRPCQDCRLSTSFAPLPHVHSSLPAPALSPLSATLMGSPRMCCKQKTYRKAKPFRCNTYTKRRGSVKLLLTRKPDGLLIWGQGCSHRHAHALVKMPPPFKENLEAPIGSANSPKTSTGSS